MVNSRIVYFELLEIMSMEVFWIAFIVLTIGVTVGMIAVFSTGQGQNTCRECGGGLPASQSASRSDDPAFGDWACPKCGTRFDRQAKARDQVAT